MSIVKQGQLREFDEKGRLTRAGYRWRQVNSAREKLWNYFFCGAIYAFGIGSFFLYMKPSADNSAFTLALVAPFWLGLIVIIACLCSLPTKDDWSNEWIAVLFCAAGDILLKRSSGSAQALADRRWVRHGDDVSEITSIEATPMRNRGGGHYLHGGSDGYPAFRIFMRFQSGERFWLTDTLTEDEAGIVVAQLLLARDELQRA